MNDLVHMSTLSGSHCSHQDHQHLGWTDTDRRNSWLYFTILYNQPPVLCTATYFTRSSAIAEGPCDASCQLKSCQLPRNSAETTYTTSSDQIDGMKLEI